MRIESTLVKDTGDAGVWRRGLVTFGLKLSKVTLHCWDNRLFGHPLQAMIWPVARAEHTTLSAMQEGQQCWGLGLSLGCLSHDVLLTLKFEQYLSIQELMCC